MANDSKADGGEGQTQRPDTSKELETSSNLLSEANLLTPTETGDEKEITDVTGSNPVAVQSTMEVVADETTETLAGINPIKLQKFVKLQFTTIVNLCSVM